MITWDHAKNNKLNRERNVTFEEIAEKIINQDVLDILENPARKSQKIFVIAIHDYTYAVPFVIDRNNTIILKTAYPSRKLHEIYRKK